MSTKSNIALICATILVMLMETGSIAKIIPKYKANLATSAHHLEQIEGGHSGQ